MCHLKATYQFRTKFFRLVQYIGQYIFLLGKRMTFEVLQKWMLDPGKFEETINIETQVKSFYVRSKFHKIQIHISISIHAVDVSDVIEYCNLKHNFLYNTYVNSYVIRVKSLVIDVVCFMCYA